MLGILMRSRLIPPEEISKFLFPMRTSVLQQRIPCNSSEKNVEVVTLEFLSSTLSVEIF